MNVGRTYSLPQTGFVRLNEILRVIPVGRSTFWARVKSGEYPQPVKLGPRTTAWRAEQIHRLIDQLTARSGTSPDRHH